MGSLPHVVEDCQGILQLFSDGSIYRHKDIDFTAFSVKDDGSVVWKDYCYDKLHNLHLRLYKPKPTIISATKLPVIYYLHGGGFCLGSFSWPNIHNSCLRLSSALCAIVVAPDYRLAPEHRLPAALDDSLGALKWLQALAINPKEDVVDSFDFDRFFIIGDSSGGNISHHLAVRLGPSSPELSPIKVRGFWRMSLPVGETADHPFSNPFGPKSPNLEPIKLDPILLIVGGDEILKDRVKLYAKRLKELGKIEHYIEFEGKQHAFFTNEPYSDVSDSVLDLIKDFMSEHSS